MEQLRVEIVEPKHPDLRQLISKLDSELSKKYPPEAIFTIDFEKPNISETIFSIAYYGQIPVGCGAIRPLEKKVIELKRFYVDSSYRNKGIASVILNFLEGKAKELHYKVIKLETGIKQSEAISFYKKHGYHEIEAFGEYIYSKSSLCFEKKL
ncbi:GNAT family N-acetyltransferase [Chengkuizengella marina]|uniref:GNAT family N-acetyltransferase n=1 Tax=Chengkuizengella marina TaxID=2507566 RepID=A0A6N9Q4H4_9BACL|nr:GNAT family N-acetyltransferase [Chengkuizengella marina]NBI29683.1 GNAT family N-acetyltransferase [Chengkuizengella marina]